MSIVVVAIFAIVLLAATTWLLLTGRDSGRGIVGTTDLWYKVSRTLAWAKEGARYTFSSVGGGTKVVIIREISESGSHDLLVEISSPCVNREELANSLERHGLIARSWQAGEGRVELVGPLPAQERAGRLVDDLLRLAGLVNGDRYRYRFDGEIDLQEMSRRQFAPVPPASERKRWKE